MSDRIHRSIVAKTVALLGVAGTVAALTAPMMATATPRVSIHPHSKSLTAYYPADPNECPPPSPDQGIDHWNKIYPGIAEPDRGVTLCVGMGGALANEPYAYLQLISPDEGARIHLISDPQECPGPNGCTAAWQFPFLKRTAEEWFTGMPDINTTLDPDQLFSVTNAGFFVEDRNDHPTSPLSLPEAKVELPGQQLSSSGWALGNHDDPAWTALKEAAWITDPTQITYGGQRVVMWDFGDRWTGAYTEWDAQMYLRGPVGEDEPSDGLVGFTMAQTGVDERARRTVLAEADGGSGLNDFVILSTAHAYTLPEVSNILDDIGALSYDRMQLDGGGSTQTFNKLGGTASLSSNSPFELRKVPEVFAVYEAPE